MSAVTRPPHDPYAALRSPNYRRFAGGFVLSSMGLQMLSTALGWEIYERTHDAFALGLVGLARAVPVMFLALPAGHAVDIFNRKWVLVLTQLAMGTLAAALALASWSQTALWVTYALLMLMGCARSFNGPSRSSLLPLIVPSGDFQNAVTWNSGVFQLSAIGGPLLAGLLIAVFDAAWPVYACTAVMAGAFALTAAGLRPRESLRHSGAITLKSMGAGLGHLWREKTILSAITLDLFAVFLGGATALMPVYAKDILHVGPLGLGALRSSPYIGALVMALVLAYRPPFIRAGPALLWSVAGFGVVTIVFGVSTSFVLSLSMLFIGGGLDNISVVIRHVLVQVRTPDELRGRVSAVNHVFIETSNELGGFESGLVASWFTPLISVVAGGIGTLIVVTGVALAWPEIRRLGKLDESALEEAAEVEVVAGAAAE
jgi:MFS family permease